ncbi:Valyl-tRNA synthetase [hydrothermal vent metagenome]|uniref:valine--tRNA ligase n=1 Tax=hydrothermal vent metagenome TaxID=652676 RepID=A0A3B0RUB0_9ZZZZ
MPFMTNPMTLDKNFDPAAIETRWYEHWETKGLFRPERSDAEPFTIVNPPPNVTGSLHIGHALDNTLQDIIIRHERLKGKDALWVVGMDHAGIATQMVVERQMNEKGQKRTDFSRELFVKKVWQWKEESGGEITNQLRRLGCSMDWSNERFTMDEGMNKAVLKVFVDLYNDGLIYRDKRLVNWDPALKTAISDLEVENVEKNGHFWHFSYPLEDGSGAISVATTRPETMLADMAVAVHPKDARYTDMVGKMVKLPITGRLIPIITDEHADPELGSGAVKITPGHDFNDFDVGKRAGFVPADMLNMLDGEAKVVQTSDGLIPDELLGMDRFDARKKVVELIDAAGLLEKVEERIVVTPYGDRGGVVIEPWLTDQWYVDAETLAGPAIEAVKSGAIEIVPKSWEKTYFNWMENIQPWCVSRQLWWGHRIPAWFDGDGNIFVAEDETTAQLEAGEGVTIIRDPDVLDTWFSSALWPFATLGWPDDMEQQKSVCAEPVEAPLSADHRPSTSSGLTAVPKPGSDLARHYPGDLLISGFDILFFWDARMAMQGIKMMGEVPWKRLYLHGLVRAEDGSKMSKSKGNVVDPLGLIDEYGADALRFFMAAMESQGRDIKMDDKRVEGYRNFATKLWNAARFCEVNGIGASKTLAAPEAALPVNRWIISEVVETLEALDKALSDLRFDAAANIIYHFTWDRFCDWYLELIKPVLNQGAGNTAPSTVRAEPVEASISSEKGPSTSSGPTGSGQANFVETKLVAGWVLDQIIVMLHPFMPFITEELWHSMGDRKYDLIVAKWPEPKAETDRDAKAEIDWLIKLVSEVRSAKVELNIAPGTKMAAHVRGGSPELMDQIARHSPALDRVGRLETITADPAPEGPSAQIVVDGATYVLPLAGAIDINAEKARLNKALEASEKEAKSLSGRLGNPNFVEKAKPEAVEKARADLAGKEAEAERLQAALARLG